MDEAYDLGSDAFYSGLLLEDNPFNVITDQDQYGDWEYGYYDEANNWVCLEEEEEEEQEQSPPRISRQGTVLEADGWERVVSRKRW